MRVLIAGAGWAEKQNSLDVLTAKLFLYVQEIILSAYSPISRAMRVLPVPVGRKAEYL
jgi:hypothetical protein